MKGFPFLLQHYEDPEHDAGWIHIY